MVKWERKGKRELDLDRSHGQKETALEVDICETYRITGLAIKPREPIKMAT